MYKCGMMHINIDLCHEDFLGRIFKDTGPLSLIYLKVEHFLVAIFCNDASHILASC